MGAVCRSPTSHPYAAATVLGILVLIWKNIFCLKLEGESDFFNVFAQKRFFFWLFWKIPALCTTVILNGPRTVWEQRRPELSLFTGGRTATNYGSENSGVRSRWAQNFLLFDVMNEKSTIPCFVFVEPCRTIIQINNFEMDVRKIPPDLNSHASFLYTLL